MAPNTRQWCWKRTRAEPEAGKMPGAVKKLWGCSKEQVKASWQTMWVEGDQGAINPWKGQDWNRLEPDLSRAGYMERPQT